MLRGPRLVHYGQSVSLIAVAPGMRLSALGVALQDGSQGQDIIVRNAHSGRVVHGVVGGDGDVIVQVGGGAQLAASNP
jgi:flagella basal body P-ring formation protein FlgA